MKPMRDAYLGPSFADDTIEATLKTYKLHFTRLGDPAATARRAALAGENSWMVPGPHGVWARALGSGRFLADPRDPEMNTKVNNAVKFREWWRPFAPSLKKEAAGDFLERTTDSPFMTLTAQVRPEKRSVIPSVTPR